MSQQYAAPGILESAPGHWLTPPDVMAHLVRHWGPFDFDPIPFPRPAGYEALAVEWGQRNYVNPPFRGKPGPTAFVRKAIAEQAKGRSSLLVLPVQSYVNLLLEAGATAFSLGRIRWLHVETGEPMRNPSPICAFYLRARGRPPGDPTP